MQNKELLSLVRHDANGKVISSYTIDVTKLVGHKSCLDTKEDLQTVADTTELLATAMQDNLVAMGAQIAAGAAYAGNFSTDFSFLQSSASTEQVSEPITEARTNADSPESDPQQGLKKN